MDYEITIKITADSFVLVSCKRNFDDNLYSECPEVSSNMAKQIAWDSNCLLPKLLYGLGVFEYT